MQIEEKINMSLINLPINIYLLLRYFSRSRDLERRSRDLERLLRDREPDLDLLFLRRRSPSRSSSL